MTGLTRVLRSRLLLVLALLLVIGGLLGWVKAWQERSVPAAENHALVDQTATAQVQAEVARGLAAVLSYDHADPALAQQAADEVLTGAARREYDTLIAALHEKAPDQQLVLSATVQAIAVKDLTEESAQMLVFLDQTSQRADDEETSISAAQLAITAELMDGAWKVTELTPL